MHIKIKDTKYSRDLSNMAVLCNDPIEVTKYQQELKRRKETRLRDEEINNLKNEVAEIKSLLKQIIDDRI